MLESYGASAALSSTLPILAQTSSDQDLGGFAGWAVDVMDALGGIGVMLLIALENLFPPIPSEIILPLAGFTANQGQSFGLVEGIIWATAGSLLGALALYSIARWFGRERTRHYMSKLPLMDMEDVDKTEAFFTRHDHSTVFFGRMLPVFRSLISLPAGVVKMPIPRFIVLTTLGSTIWNTLLVGAGYILGENWQKVETVVGNFSTVIVVILIVLVLAWVGWKIYQRKKAKDHPDSSDGDSTDGSTEHDNPDVTGYMNDDDR